MVITQKMKEVLSQAGSNDPAIALPAMQAVALSLTQPLREGLFPGDIISNIFSEVPLDKGTWAEFPLDPVPPGQQKNFVGYTIPKHGYIPQRTASADFVLLQTYDIGNSIDWPLRMSERSRWDIVQRFMKVFQAGMVKKMNDDGFHTLLYAGLDRNIVVYDSDAGSGQFTKRLVSLMNVMMTRQGGGNSATPNKSKLTDILMSPENIADMKNWGIDIVDEVTRRELFLSSSDSFMRVFNVNLHSIYELGEGQEYQMFYEHDLAGSLQTNDVELLVGLDLSNPDSFVSPTFNPQLEVFPDNNLHRQQRHGIYGWKNIGFGVLDNRRIILGSC